MKNRNLPLVILLVCACAFGLGILELFKLRFEAGDVYPPYSTLRADPLGASAFYEGLEKLPGISVNRDFRPTDQLPDGRDTVYLQLGGEPDSWEELPTNSFKEIETFVKGGGRLVIAFSPEPSRHLLRSASDRPLEDKDKQPVGKDKDQTKPKSKSAKSAKMKKKISGEDDQPFHWISLAEHWGISFSFKNMKQGTGDAYEPLVVENLNGPSMPESMPWHSGAVMTNLDKAWRVIYTRGQDPVLVERRFGRGTVVFSTDSYFLSNEAMQKDRHAELLAWLVGPSRQVMFDEAHFGIVENPGIAALLRKYQLHGLVAGLLLLAGLFIWKNSAGFGPARGEEQAAVFVVGKDSAAGFINLLRHHVKPQDVLGLCITEWKKSQATRRLSAMRIERVEAFMQTVAAHPPKDRGPVQTYQTICAILKKNSEWQITNSEPSVTPEKI